MPCKKTLSPWLVALTMPGRLLWLAMAKLFEEPEHQPELPPDGLSADGPTVEVAVNAHVWGRYHYLWPEALGEPFIGQRVRLPFGRGDRKRVGFVTDLASGPVGRKLKAVAEIIDTESQLDPHLLELASWISSYYLCPLGMTLGAMVPAAAGKAAQKTERVVFSACEQADWPTSLGPKQRKILDELHEAKLQSVEPLSLKQLRTHAGATPDTIRRLDARGLIRIETRRVELPELDDAQAEAPFELNADQANALAAIEPKLTDAFSATLLHGVTGSGKTEVYVRAIRNVIASGKQAILLVPEIALATQTLQRLVKRLPKVAVLHSGLTETQRGFYHEQIRTGRANVVVGPRSAVFAPTPKLGLIIVDEEHESSYKQDTAPRYNGRDVAVKRAALAGVPILLGSATPSLESLHNVQLGRYEMLRLPSRVRNLQMPKLKLVHLRKEITPGKIELLGRTLTGKIAATLDRREQIILLLNRRGYASYVFCPSCNWTLTCRDCTRALVFHRTTQLAMCHYCQHTETIPRECPACSGKIIYFGYGIQRIESEMGRKFPQANFARMDSDTMTSPKQFQEVFDGFGSGKIDILLGTQMVAKGLDFPRVGLVGVVSADTSLAISDFRAAERTFQLIVQVAGRAGRADVPGEVIVQTLHAEEPAIQFALKHDYDGFSAMEMPLRKEAAVPPYVRMVRFVCRHAKNEQAQDSADELARCLRDILPKEHAQIFGPMPAPVFKIKDKFRFEVLVKTDRAGLVQDALGPQMAELSRKCHAEIIADVDPMNLM